MFIVTSFWRIWTFKMNGILGWRRFKSYAFQYRTIYVKIFRFFKIMSQKNTYTSHITIAHFEIQIININTNYTSSIEIVTLQVIMVYFIVHCTLITLDWQFAWLNDLPIFIIYIIEKCILFTNFYQLLYSTNIK